MKSVKVQLLLDALAEANQVGVNQEEFTERVMFNAQRLGIAPEEYFSRLQEGNQLGAVFAEVRRGKALAAAVEQATVTNTSGEVLDVAALFGIEADERPRSCSGLAEEIERGAIARSEELVEDDRRGGRRGGDLAEEIVEEAVAEELRPRRRQSTSSTRIGRGGRSIDADDRSRATSRAAYAVGACRIGGHAVSEQRATGTPSCAPCQWLLSGEIPAQVGATAGRGMPNPSTIAAMWVIEEELSVSHRHPARRLEGR